MEVAGANRRWRLLFRYRGSRRESAVAQLFSLIWLTIVKRAISLLSEIFIFRFASPRTILSQQQGRHDCGFNAEIRESTRDVHTPRSYQQVTVRGGANLRLGSRISPRAAC